MTTTPSTASTASLSIKDQLKAQQALLGLSNQELCTLTGFSSEAALRLIQEGVMRLPLTAVPAFAQALRLDPAAFFKAALSETDPALLKVIENVFNPLCLSAAEVKLIERARNPGGSRQGASLEVDERGTIAATGQLQAQDPRYSALPVRTLLTIRMKDLGVKNVDLQKVLGYPYPNVIAMIKSGAMRLPANKAIVTAQLLKIDPIFLLGKVVAENDPDLWTAISTLIPQQWVTANELALIEWVRQGLDGHDVDLTEHHGFVRAVSQELKSIQERECALVQAAMNRTDD